MIVVIDISDRSFQNRDRAQSGSTEKNIPIGFIKLLNNQIKTHPTIPSPDPPIHIGVKPKYFFSPNRFDALATDD